MYCVSRRTMAAVVLAGIATASSGPVLAQSGNRTTPPGGSGYRDQAASDSLAPSGSGQRSAQQAPLALEGYCPVSILEMRKWVKGDPAYRDVYDGRTYLFANEQGQKMFEANPAKYVPALGGDCVVALVKMGRRVPGDIRHAAIHGNRLFLLSDAQAQQIFLRNPSLYANADLAYGGYCVVCRVGMQQAVPGNPEIATVHKGLRYLFAAEDQRRQFLADPARYEKVAGERPPAQAGSSPGLPSGGFGTPPSSGSGSSGR